MNKTGIYILILNVVFQACVEKPYIPPNMLNLYRPCNGTSFHFDFFHKNNDTTVLVGLFPVNCPNSFVDETCPQFVVELTIYDDMRFINRLDSFRFELSRKDLQCWGNVCSFQIFIRLRPSLIFTHIKILNPCKDILYWHFDVCQRNNVWRQHLMFRYPGGKPITNGFVKKTDTIQIIANENHINKLYVYKKSEDTELIPEKPYVFQNYSRKRLHWDYYRTLTRNEMQQGFVFQEKGLYFFSVDSILTYDAIERGRGILVVDKSYPFITEATEMLNPMLYLLNEYEYKVIQSDESLQRAIEMFWIKNSQSIHDARKKMQIFYQRAEEANMLFTADREGWATDRGMIYIICGPPTYIQKAPGFERWFYGSERSLFSTMFEFYKTQALTQTGDYFLFRYPQYKEFWEKHLNAWRK